MEMPKRKRNPEMAAEPDMPRYPTARFNGTPAIKLLPKDATVGEEFLLAARVKLSGVQKHEGEGEWNNSVELSVLEAELSKPKQSDKERAGKMYTSSK